VIPISKPWLGDEEKQAVAAVLESGQLAQGARVSEFEERFAEYCRVRHAVATSSGTTALWVALLAHGIGPGDEVITSPFTFIASANAILYTGAKPVFVDIEPDTFNIDARQIEAKITSHTKAILPIHLFGYPCDMNALMGIADKHHLAVIEDACQAHGADIDGKRAGSWGTGCFSFYATKNMAMGEGGIITTNDDAVADRARLLRAHGMRQRYYHESLGYNFRLTDIQAAIGVEQLKKLERYNERRIANARYLNAHLEGVVTPTIKPGYRHVFHQYTIRVKRNRDQAVAKLAEKGVGSGIFYPVPVHRQQVYQELGYRDDLPESEAAAREVLSLPIHPQVSERDLVQIAQAVNEIC
jgi:perosamine synthetase